MYLRLVVYKRLAFRSGGCQSPVTRIFRRNGPKIDAHRMWRINRHQLSLFVSVLPVRRCHRFAPYKSANPYFTSLNVRYAAFLPSDCLHSQKTGRIRRFLNPFSHQTCQSDAWKIWEAQWSILHCMYLTRIELRPLKTRNSRASFKKTSW